jgi:hypothetical protein
MFRSGIPTAHRNDDSEGRINDLATASQADGPYSKATERNEKISLPNKFIINQLPYYFILEQVN